MTNFQTREEWLQAGVNELRTSFDMINKALPKRIRVACGFPLNAKRSKAIGECWASDNSADKTIEILISPTIADPIDVFAVLVHELCHSTSGAMNHGINFQKVANAMLLESCADPDLPMTKNAWKSTRGNAQFASAYGDLINGLGLYPHGELSYSDRKVQGTRMIKASCPVCGYTVRLTGKWLAQGLPSCPTDGETFTV
jgi:hypothetical protein